MLEQQKDVTESAATRSVLVVDKGTQMAIVLCRKATTSSRGYYWRSAPGTARLQQQKMPTHLAVQLGDLLFLGSNLLFLLLCHSSQLGGLGCGISTLSRSSSSSSSCSRAAALRLLLVRTERWAGNPTCRMCNLQQYATQQTACVRSVRDVCNKLSRLFAKAHSSSHQRRLPLQLPCCRIAGTDAPDQAFLVSSKLGSCNLRPL